MGLWSSVVKPLWFLEIEEKPLWLKSDGHDLRKDLGKKEGHGKVLE